MTVRARTILQQLAADPTIDAPQYERLRDLARELAAEPEPQRSLALRQVADTMQDAADEREAAFAAHALAMEAGPYHTARA